ncbi:Galactosylgalactosylxylosylprotein 3-beta-glucuronosyltransferase 2 [Sparganum proliferum]
MLLSTVFFKKNVEADIRFDFKASPPITTIFVITPTYYRLTQKPELIRLCSAFSHVPDLHWIIIEDSSEKTDLVKRFAEECKVPITHLFASSPNESRRIKGSNQRNRGLQWILQNVSPEEQSGVVYFADDDNTYDPRIFEQMRNTRRGSTWPVGLVGGRTWEGCVTDCVDKNTIVRFVASFNPSRKFPIDMAAFAFNVKLLHAHPNASFDYVHTEEQEGLILTQLGFRTAFDLEPKANGCSEILVWHTKTQKPKITAESILDPAPRRCNDTAVPRN